jgi:hypothetical protein
MGSKNSVLKRETPKRTDASSTIPPGSSLGLMLASWSEIRSRTKGKKKQKIIKYCCSEYKSQY